MNASVIPWVCAALAGAAAAGVAWALGRLAAAGAGAGMGAGRKQERRLPFLFRALLPLTTRANGFFSQPGFNRARTRVHRQLVQAGFDDALMPDEFLSLQALMTVGVGGGLALLLLALTALSKGGLDAALQTRPLTLAILCILFCGLYPSMWLSRTIRFRLQSIMRALPFVIDLLTLSVEAGLDFMAAIKNIIARRDPDPIGEEWNRVLLEIQLGKTRREALKNMAARIRQPDVQSLVTALVQADEMGVSIGAILRIQADQIRQRRFTRAEKLANEAPVKMLFPLLVFIFPAVFLILLGPVVLQVARSGF